MVEPLPSNTTISFKSKINLISLFSLTVYLDLKHFTGALCQQAACKYSSPDIPAMPPCDFKPEEFKVKAIFSKLTAILVGTVWSTVLSKLTILVVFILFVQGMSKERMLEIRKQNCNPMTMKVTSYKQPVFIHQGYMQWLWDVDGKRYLDLFAGVATVSVGHCHP